MAFMSPDDMYFSASEYLPSFAAMYAATTTCEGEFVEAHESKRGMKIIRSIGLKL
jgi:hypothetical protein